VKTRPSFGADKPFFYKSTNLKGEFEPKANNEFKLEEDSGKLTFNFSLRK
jgi:hypothetical protein